MPRLQLGAIAALIPSILLAQSRPATGPTMPPTVVVSQKQSVIPLVRAGDFLLVPVRVNGRDAGLFLLDTGATQTVISSKLAAALGLSSVGTAAGSGIGGDLSVTVHPIDELSIGSVSLRHLFVGGSAKDEVLDALGVDQIGGVLGNELLRRVPLRISFREASLTVYDRGSFVPPPDAKRISVQINPLHFVPAVEAEFESHTLSGSFGLDTGSNGGPHFFHNFVFLKARTFRERPFKRAYAVGASGSLGTRAISLTDMDLFGSHFTNVPAEFTLRARGDGGEYVGGNIGMRILRQFDLTFDYDAAAVWVVDHGRTIPAEWERADFDPMAADVTGMTPLMRAIEYGQDSYVSKFLNAGADVRAADNQGISTLHYAARFGDGELVKSLLARGASPNAKSREQVTPLHSAAKDGTVESVQALLDAGAEMEASDVRGQTPLMYAAGCDRDAAVLALLKAGAKPDALSVGEGAAPHLAAAGGWTKVVRILLDAHADPNLSTGDRHGDVRPLRAAAGNGNVELIKLLLERGADINVRDAEGRTPLIYAIAGHWSEAVQYLLANGASRELRDKAGKLPFDYAFSQNDVDVANMLYNWSLKEQPTQKP